VKQAGFAIEKIADAAYPVSDRGTFCLKGAVPG
jgi:hypothetical protein